MARRHRTSGRSRLLATLAALLSLVIPLRAGADPIDRSAPARVMRTWTVEDGLPINGVTGIVQDEEGFLWLSTLGGLVRFDGLTFTTHDSQRYPGLPSDRLTTLYRAPDGVLWSTTEQHDLVGFDGERFHRLEDDPLFAGEDVVRTAAGNDGWLAFGTHDGVGVVGPDGARWLLPDTIRGSVEALLWSESGRLWAAVGGALHAIEAPLSRNPEAAGRWSVGAETLVLAEGDETLWIGTTRGLLSLVGGVLETAHPAIPQAPVPRLALDEEGVLYVDVGEVWTLLEDRAELRATESASGWRQRMLVPFPGGRSAPILGKTVTTPGGDRLELPAEIRATLLDRDGNTWMAPDGEGLILWRDSPLRVLGRPEGLPVDRVYPVVEASDGSIWLGLLGAGAARIPADGGPIESYREIDPVWSIAEIDGEIWLAGDGLCRVAGDRCVRESHPGRKEYRMLHQTRSGMVLLAGSRGTLFEREESRWRPLHDEIPGWPGTQPIRTVVEGEDGDLWLGTNGSGIVHLRGHQVERIGTGSGLSSDLIRALHLDGRGSLLIGTENRGLCRLRLADHRIDCIDEEERLHSAGIHWVEADDRGRLWMSSNRGIFWIQHDELLAVLDGDEEVLGRSGSFDGRSGMRTSEANGGIFPGGTKDGEGRLWWPTQEGLVIVDPRSDPIEVPPVTSRIRSVIVGDRRIAPPGDRLELEPGRRTLRLELQAPSYFDPPAIEFRLRVPRIDEAWIDLGRSRTAGPIVVPRGEVVIETAARNAGGEWQEKPTRLRLFVPPLWHERTSVQASLGLAVLSLVGFGIWSRDRGAHRRALELEREVAARTAEVEDQKEAIAELSQRRTDLFANIGHELRTPLTLILGPLEDARRSRAGIEPPVIETLARSARRMSRLVNQILDLQKLDAGRLSIEREEIELVGFVTRACRPFALLAEQAGIRFTMKSTTRRAVSDVDPDQLEKILANLLSNAFKFSPAGAPVELLLRGRDGEVDEVELVVTDSGPGIPEEKIGRIFERFYQVEGGLTRATEGSGIGLSLARELARLHGGEITAANRPEGGARFVVRLPCQELDPGDGPVESIRSEDAAGPPDPISDDVAGGDTQRTVLVVEDDDELREYVADCIRDRYRILQAGDGEEGLSLAHAHLPDLVISDVMMPGVDGLTMLRRLRADPETRSIPVILLTARGMGEAELEGLASGADDYIAKPFNRQSLRARIDSRFRVRERLLEALEQNRLREEEAPVGREAELVAKARSLVRDHLEEPAFGVRELAEGMFMSRSRLHRWMTEELETTPGGFIREIRLGSAAALLRQGFSVTEVGIATGFSSLASFSRTFKKAHGLSPSAYAENR